MYTKAMTTTKQCIHCVLVKDISLFVRKKRIRKTTGEVVFDIQNVCRSCKSRKASKYKGNLSDPIGLRNHTKIYESRKDAKIAARKRSTERNRDFIKALLSSSSCNDCGHNDWRVLEFDNLPTHTKDRDISDMICIGISLKKLSSEIAKCDIVCSNCHSLRTFQRSNSWRMQ